MTLLSLGLLSFWACGDKSLDSDTDTTSQPASEPSSLPSDDPIIEEELEPLEPVAVGLVLWYMGPKCWKLQVGL